MEIQQQSEWLEAQKLAICVDLLPAAKQHLHFLAAVDKNRYLYEGPALEYAIYRYNACWLPMLAEHSKSPIFEGPLVVPLDCEWVWHCHRLNPIRYKTDCEELYGRMLDNSNVVSSVNGNCWKETEEKWNSLYPDEPYVFDLTRALSAATNEKLLAIEKCTTYDLVSAVKRQSPFHYQVSRPHVNNDIFLKEAVDRYKGFLYLIKRNRERSIRCFCVPTYDIDLIWHTHQLHPVSYCKDLNEALGKILEHDDMDSDRTKGKKLDTGFSGTTKQWEQTFGTRYWKAGAMYRGSEPSPITNVPFLPYVSRKDAPSENDNQKIIQLPELKIVEVFLEIVGVKNIPDEHKGSLLVSFSKKQPDAFFNVKRKLSILSKSREKQVASFQCEPKGELHFELISNSPSNLLVTRGFKTMGTASLSLQDFLNPVSKLAEEKWVDLLPSSGGMSSNPICLRIAISFTVPTEAPRVLYMVRPQSLSSCFFPLPGKIQHVKGWTNITDEIDTEIISLQMRGSNKTTEKDKSIQKKQVIGATKSGETHALAEFVGTQWSLMDSQWSLQLKAKSNEVGHLFEHIGSRMIKLFKGRKLDFEAKEYKKQRNEQNFITAVEFSPEDPYGKSMALLDLKSASIKVKEERLVLSVIISAFILTDILKNEGHGGFLVKGESLKELDDKVEEVSGFHEEAKQLIQVPSTESKLELNVNSVKSGGCGSGCGGGCRTMIKTGGCGGGCGSGCGGDGSMIKSGGCGSGCGGNCGGLIESGGCGGGCSGECGGMAKSGGCGGGCGSGCGGGGGCSGGCGGMIHIDDACPKESPFPATEAVAA
ncbi:glycine-rich domain-containing protein 1 [Euphorbia lathyris]|uniref:glycine-rich domain-containing protein 1 n=1 Tax=Euphorbia lathyris TaxID=212925 RepID=UPI0033143295